VLAGAGTWLALSVVHQYWPMSTGWSRIFVPEWAPYFVAGVGFALLATDGPGAGPTRSQRRAALVLTAVSCAWSLRLGVSFADSLTAKYGIEFSGAVVVSVLLATFAAFAALVAGVTVPGAGRVAFLGGLTYPLYLVHENIGYTLLTIGNVRLGVDRWVVLGTVCAVVVASAWALHRFVEEPGSRRVSGWTRRLAKRQREHTRRASLPQLWRRGWRALPGSAPAAPAAAAAAGAAGAATATHAATAGPIPARAGLTGARGPLAGTTSEPRALAAYAGFTPVSRAL